MRPTLRLASLLCLGSLALCPVTLVAQDDQDRESESITVDRERAADLRPRETVKDPERKTATQTLDRQAAEGEQAQEQERPAEEAEAQPARPVPVEPKEAEVIEPEPSVTEAAEATSRDRENPETADPAPSRPPIQRGGSLLGRAPPPPPPAPPPEPSTNPTTPAPDSLPYEPGELLLVSADMAEAQSAARQLQGYQLRVKSRQRLDNLGLIASVFRLPPGTDTPALVAQVQQDLPNLNLDTNQRYQLLNARRRYAQQMIAWPENIGACEGQFRIGMLDTAVNDQHPSLTDSQLTRRNFVRGTSAGALHGTAVASLLVGSAGSETPGLLPGSTLWAAEVFRQRGEYTDTSTEILLSALDWLVSQRVQAINLSLGGERNRVFELALERLLENRVLLIAAAGNQGPEAPPSFPAAQPGVIAVTAVDAAERLYPDANRGDYIDLAAPGVDLWAADGDVTGRYHTGTSFAAPLVTAASLVAQEQGADLMAAVKDLGPRGQDDRFGWGLVQVGNWCN